MSNKYDSSKFGTNIVHRQWKKVLYECQGYSDNYTDKSFLRDLRKNIDVEEVNIFEAIIGTFVLVQELCIVITFVLIYVFMYNGWSDPYTTLYHTSIVTICGFLFYRIYYKRCIRPIVSQDLRTVLIFLVFGHLFSPVLHTLTDTISTDTIYTMTFFMMLVHIIFSDYGVPAALISNSLSLSASIFGSVCLASRLPSAYHAFVLLTVAIECFVLFPFLRIKIRKMFLPTVVLVFIIVFILSSLSLILTTLFIGSVILVSLICPYLFTSYQKYKDNIYGPWDEAVINDADSINELIY